MGYIKSDSKRESRLSTETVGMIEEIDGGC